MKISYESIMTPLGVAELEVNGDAVPPYYLMGTGQTVFRPYVREVEPGRAEWIRVTKSYHRPGIGQFGADSKFMGEMFQRAREAEEDLQLGGKFAFKFAPRTAGVLIVCFYELPQNVTHVKVGNPAILVLSKKGLTALQSHLQSQRADLLTAAFDQTTPQFGLKVHYESGKDGDCMVGWDGVKRELPPMVWSGGEFPPLAECYIRDSVAPNAEQEQLIKADLENEINLHSQGTLMR